MPISLAQIANNTATVSFTYAGEAVTLQYYPSRITEKTIAQMQAFAKMNESTISAGFHAFNETLVSLIKSWDVYEDLEQTTLIPLDAERFASIPIAFRIDMLNAIMGDISPEAMAPKT